MSDAQNELDGIWGRRSLKLPVPDGWNDLIQKHDIAYLKSRCPYIQILNIDATERGIKDVEVSTTSSGWPIHDSGDAICTSTGALLYGDSTPIDPIRTDRTDEEHLKGTLIKQTIDVGQELVLLAMAKGWTGIHIVSGSELLCWILWLTGRKNQFRVSGFSPTEEMIKRQGHIEKMLLSGFEGYQPEKAPKKKR